VDGAPNPSRRHHTASGTLAISRPQARHADVTLRKNFEEALRISGVDWMRE
jgi:hypothetical protein